MRSLAIDYVARIQSINNKPAGQVGKSDVGTEATQKKKGPSILIVSSVHALTGALLKL